MCALVCIHAHMKFFLGQILQQCSLGPIWKSTIIMVVYCIDRYWLLPTIHCQYCRCCNRSELIGSHTDILSSINWQGLEDGEITPYCLWVKVLFSNGDIDSIWGQLCEAATGLPPPPCHQWSTGSAPISHTGEHSRAGWHHSCNHGRDNDGGWNYRVRRKVGADTEWW